MMPLPEVYMGEAHLQQVFQNLIGNALKYRTESAAPNPYFRRPIKAPPGAFQCRTTASASIRNIRRKSLAFSNGSITIRSTAAPASDWLFASGWLSVMAGESGSNPNPGKDPPSSSPSPNTPEQSDPQRLNLLLAEDNLPDALLVREAIRMENLPLDVHIAADGEQAIDFIAQAEKDPGCPSPACSAARPQSAQGGRFRGAAANSRQRKIQRHSGAGDHFLGFAGRIEMRERSWAQVISGSRPTMSNF